MFSPSDLVARLGVGGGLVPFFKCVGVYFAVGGGGPGAGAAAAKCAPVLSLLAAVLLRPAPPRERRYARLVGLALAASALGDALLVWPEHLAPGMAAFGAAHVCYCAAFRPRARRLPAGLALYAAAAGYLRLLSPPPALAALVPLYAALLATMAWRALCAVGSPARGGPPRALAAAAGALLFLLSDAILGYSLFGGDVPHKQVLVMSTYYLGQLGLALSALLPSAPAAPAPPAPALPAPAPAPAAPAPPGTALPAPAPAAPAPAAAIVSSHT